MKFQGGKARYAKELVELMKPENYWCYVEPFLGGGWVASEVAKRFEGPMILSDSHRDLMMMWNALKDGWVPPSDVSEEYYQALRNEKPSHMRGFVGFACSYGGKFFGGYARGDGRNFAAEAVRSLEKKRHMFERAVFSHSNYKYLSHTGCLIYCDPPYKGTTGYKTDDFDYEHFWDWVRSESRRNQVFVSEYEAPDDFIVVAEFNHFESLTAYGKRGVRSERVFTLA